MTNLAGHDLPALIDAFGKIDHDRPICFIAYTIKGFGLPFAGHKDNHAGLMTPAQMERFRATMQVRPGTRMGSVRGARHRIPTCCSAFSTACRSPRARAAIMPPGIAAPAQLAVPLQPVMSTQQGFGALLNELGRERSEIADRIVTTSPDVTVSTNLGAWVNRRGLFAREKLADTFKSEQIPSTFNWDFSPKGQHIELGIAEMNLFILLSALGLSHAINGERLIPIGTLYDPFIQRGLDALNYACYQDARFILVATPSGITLAPEGGAHQSIGTPLIGMAQDGLAAFEPAYVDELAVIVAFAFDYMQREEGEISERNWLRDETGGSVYLRLSTRPLEQIRREMTPELSQAIVDGGYWLRKPGPNCQVTVAYTGAVAPEAIQAVGLMAEDRRDVGLLAVTSADRLNAGWTAAQRARERGLVHARSPHREAAGRTALPLRHRFGDRWPSGDARLARRRARPPHAAARRRAFRPDRLHPRALPALRHRCQCHRGGRRHADPRPPDPAPQGAAVAPARQRPRHANSDALRASDNSDMRSTDYRVKKSLYAASPYVLTQHVAEADDWTPDAISARRQRVLSDLALRAWPL